MVAWYPPAKRILSPAAGWQTMDGTHGTRKLVLHNEGLARPRADAEAVARWVNSRGSLGIQYHLIYSYDTDSFAQCMPLDKGARALGNNGRYPSSPNRQGELAVQVCLAGFGPDFAGTHRPLMSVLDRRPGWRHFARFAAEELRIPSVTHVDWTRPGRAWSDWVKSGWVGHCHAPGNDHTDGRGENPSRLWYTDSLGDDDMGRYGEVARRDSIPLRPGEAAWIPWQVRRFALEEATRGGSSLVRLGGHVIQCTLDAVVECDRPGRVVVSFAEHKAGKGVVSDDRHDHMAEAGRARLLVSDIVKLSDGGRLRVSIRNRTSGNIMVQHAALRALIKEA